MSNQEKLEAIKDDTKDDDHASKAHEQMLDSLMEKIKVIHNDGVLTTTMPTTATTAASGRFTNTVKKGALDTKFELQLKDASFTYF